MAENDYLHRSSQNKRHHSLRDLRFLSKRYGLDCDLWCNMQQAKWFYRKICCLSWIFFFFGKIAKWISLGARCRDKYHFILRISAFKLGRVCHSHSGSRPKYSYNHLRSVLFDTIPQTFLIFTIKFTTLFFYIELFLLL